MLNNTGPKPTIVVYSYDDKDSACSIMRIIKPMLTSNWNVIWASKNDASGFSFNIEPAYQADVILIHRLFPSKGTENILRSLMALNIPVIYDLDDLFLDVPSCDHPTYQKYAPYIKWILKEADMITVSTIPLKLSLGKYTNRPIYVQPNIVDFNLFASTPRICDSTFNFLVSGSNTHQRDWAIIEEPIKEILKKYQEKVSIVFFGDTPKRFVGHSSVKIIDFQPNYKLYAAQLRALDVHAALTPLEDTKYNQVKSNIKWLEYSAAGIPGAYSDLTPYSDCINHEQNGLLVKNNPESWFNAIQRLLMDAENTATIIKNAHREVLERHSIENALEKYTSTINSMIGRKHKTDVFSELPIAHYRLYNNILSLVDKHITWRFNI